VNASVLSGEEQRKLLRWARQTIEAAVRGDSQHKVSEAELTDALRAPHGAFVTLKKHGELRGCIGRMDFERPLWENVIAAAVSSALEDPRFTPVQPDELAELQLEISVLNPPEVLPRAEQFDPQRHGIIVEKGWNHALLLPKVAQEYGWDAEKTLETVCLKAGLSRDAWREPDARLQVFTAFDFGEGQAGE
jgi:AmmeMemoRadiSam system protein A